MATNYTNNDFLQMRDQAIVRAREMQRRAAIKDIPDQPQIAYENSNTLRFEKRSSADESSKNMQGRKNAVHRSSALDDDRMLIMTLLLILIADGADKMLIFALMYIMM